MSDLDVPAFSKSMGRDVDERALRTLKLTREDFAGNVVPTNAGVLVACPNPEVFLPFAWVQCARFRGEGKRNITDQANVYGPLPRRAQSRGDLLRDRPLVARGRG
jgi:predicted HTH transcriptional regulator